MLNFCGKKSWKTTRKDETLCKLQKKKKCSQNFTQEVSFIINYRNNQKKRASVSLGHQERCMMIEKQTSIIKQKSTRKETLIKNIHTQWIIILRNGNWDAFFKMVREMTRKFSLNIEIFNNCHWTLLIEIRKVERLLKPIKKKFIKWLERLWKYSMFRNWLH